MREALNRINEIKNHIHTIQKRFSPNNLNHRTEFKNKLIEMQDAIYNKKSMSIKRYESIIQKNARKYTVPEKLIKSIIKQESNFNSKAVSPKGAKGLMQLMPETAKFLGVKNIFNPEENIQAGVKYFRQMLNKFDGDVEKALAAYNAGPQAVENYKGVPNYVETKNYVYNILKNMESF